MDLNNAARLEPDAVLFGGFCRRTRRKKIKNQNQELGTKWATASLAVIRPKVRGYSRKAADSFMVDQYMGDGESACVSVC